MIDTKPPENLCQVWEMATPQSEGFRTQEFKYFEFTQDWKLIYRNAEGIEIKSRKFKIEGDKILLFPKEQLFGELVQATENLLVLNRPFLFGEATVPELREEKYSAKSQTESLSKEYSISELRRSICNSKWEGTINLDKADLLVSLQKKDENPDFLSLIFLPSSEKLERELNFDAEIIEYDELLLIKISLPIEGMITPYIPITRVSEEEIHFDFSTRNGSSQVVLNRIKE